MSELQDKLRNVLFDTVQSAEESGYAGGPISTKKQITAQCDELIDQIKQAFADAGYAQVSNLQEIVNFATQARINRLVNHERYPAGRNLMTGQEWYERFMKELNEVTFLRDDIDGLDGYETYGTKQAAKRAAGIDTDNKA